MTAFYSRDEKLSQIITLFHRLFSETENVGLSGGYREPFYQASVPGIAAKIQFTRDYLNSCFHEVAHWCIAGKARRQKDDYGYWYWPDGRDGEKQRAFFQAEAGPQALEWAFATASGETFRMSCDNLSGEVSGEMEFAKALEMKRSEYLQRGFPERGEKFLAGLMEMFHPEIAAERYSAWLGQKTLVQEALASECEGEV